MKDRRTSLELEILCLDDMTIGEEFVGEMLQRNVPPGVIEVKQRGGSPIGAGLPELTNILVSLGSAGLFVIVKDIIMEVLRRKQKARVKITLKKEDGTSIEIESQRGIAEVEEELRRWERSQHLSG